MSILVKKLFLGKKQKKTFFRKKIFFSKTTVNPLRKKNPHGAKKTLMGQTDLRTKKNFWMGNQKWQKNSILKIWKSPKKVKFEHFWENSFVGVSVWTFCFDVDCHFNFFLPKKIFSRFRGTKPIYPMLFEQNWSIFRYFRPFLARKRIE